MLKARSRFLLRLVRDWVGTYFTKWPRLPALYRKTRQVFRFTVRDWVQMYFTKWPRQPALYRNTNQGFRFTVRDWVYMYFTEWPRLPALYRKTGQGFCLTEKQHRRANVENSFEILIDISLTEFHDTFARKREKVQRDNSQGCILPNTFVVRSECN